MPFMEARRQVSYSTITQCGGFRLGRSFLAILAVVGFYLSVSSGCGSLIAQGRNAEGVRQFDQARYQASIDQFHRAIANDPNEADGYYNLGSAHHRLWGLSKKESNLKQAEMNYHMCLDRDPNHRECHRGLAVLLVEQGQGKEAFQLLEDWADEHPEAAAPKIELARLFEESGDRAAAKEHLIEALGVDHDNARALAALGRLREQTGETAQAMIDYQRSLWKDRFQPEVSARIAALQSALGPTRMRAAPSSTHSSPALPSGVASDNGAWVAVGESKTLH